MASKFLNANTSVNLGVADDEIPSQKAVKTYVDTSLEQKQDILSQGTGINITGNTVSTNNIVWRQW